MDYYIVTKAERVIIERGIRQLAIIERHEGNISDAEIGENVLHRMRIANLFIPKAGEDRS